MSAGAPVGVALRGDSLSQPGYLRQRFLPVLIKVAVTIVVGAFILAFPPLVQAEVVQVVVRLNAVDMVDDLGSIERSPEALSHNKAVLENVILRTSHSRKGFWAGDEYIALTQQPARIHDAFGTTWAPVKLDASVVHLAGAAALESRGANAAINIANRVSRPALSPVVGTAQTRASAAAVNNGGAATFCAAYAGKLGDVAALHGDDNYTVTRADGQPVHTERMG